MYELKKMEKYLRVNLLGPGPRLMEKELTGPRSHKGWETLCVHLGFTPAQQGLIPRSGSLRRQTHTWCGELPGIAIYMPKRFSWVDATGSWRRSFTSYSVEMDLGTSNPLLGNGLTPRYFGTATALSAGCRFVKICPTPIYIECRLHVWGSRDKLLRLRKQTLN